MATERGGMRNYLGLAVLILVAVACGSSDDDPPAPAGTIEGVRAPDEDVGIFASPRTKGRGTGTRVNPFATLNEAVIEAHSRSKAVYACAETFVDPVLMLDGVSIFGNYDCDSWIAVDRRAKIAPTSSPAVRAGGITHPTTLGGVDIIAPNGTQAAPSSIALIVTDSTGLTIADTSLTAGDAADGVNGTEGIALTLNKGEGAPSIEEGPCSPALFCATTHGRTTLGGVAECLDAEGRPSEFHPGAGGAGGSSGVFKALCVTIGQPDVCSWTPRDPITEMATTGQRPEIVENLDGKSGASAPAGTFSSDGYVPGDGTAGENGKPGYGGRGGDGATPTAMVATPTDQRIGTAGGSGGAGGCPGLAGTRGTGGGASIGTLLFSSPITFYRVRVASGKGGNGGKGTFGSASTNGGAGGLGEGTIGGEAGSPGGQSGISGSGSGGPSIGIVSRDGTPKLVETIAVPGKGGEGVVEMIQEGGKTLPASPSGMAEGSYTLSLP